jgi:thioredoxin-related protein
MLFAQVHFEQGLSWQQVKEKAKKERKYIFVDCYATWCVPCKKMNQEVYPDTAIGKIMNQLFICVKVQMDSTKNDNEAVRSWYTDAKQIEKENHVGTFPTSLFFSRNGELLHKYVGYSVPINFLNQAFYATDPDKQEYAVLEKYKKGTLPDYAIPSLITELERAEETTVAKETAQKYTNDYLLKLPDTLLFSRYNMKLIGNYLQSSADHAFALFYKRKTEVDKAVAKGYADQIVGGIITKEEIYPKIWADNKRTIPIKNDPDWAAIAENIKEKYNAAYADMTLTDPQIDFYNATKNWTKLVDVEMHKVETSAFDSAGKLIPAWANPLNNITFNYFFTYSTNKNIIKKAANWQKMVIDLHPTEPDYLDTYANLLYKIGERKQAIQWETKVLALQQAKFDNAFEGNKTNGGRNEAYLISKKKEIDEVTATLQKMKAGKKTWPITNN